jgi:hypothetical protein
MYHPVLILNDVKVSFAPAKQSPGALAGKRSSTCVLYWATAVGRLPLWRTYTAFGAADALRFRLH